MIKPGGCLVEIAVTCIAIAGKRCLFIRIERRDETAASQIGMFGDEPDQRRCRKGGGDHQILVFLQLQADLHSHFRQLFEFFYVDHGFAHLVRLSIRNGCIFAAKGFKRVGGL